MVKIDFHDFQVWRAENQGNEYRSKSAGAESGPWDVFSDYLLLGMSPPAVTRAVVEQLQKREPVLIGIDLSYLKKPFETYTVVGKRNLNQERIVDVPLHALVAVGVCDRHPTEDWLCARFTRDLVTSHIRECVVLQNSWGKSAHNGGYVCLSKGALQKMLVEAVLDHPAEDPLFANLPSPRGGLNLSPLFRYTSPSKKKLSNR